MPKIAERAGTRSRTTQTDPTSSIRGTAIPNQQKQLMRTIEEKEKLCKTRMAREKHASTNAYTVSVRLLWSDTGLLFQKGAIQLSRQREPLSRETCCDPKGRVGSWS